MKAERTEPKQEFVPVIVTLESQEEVDALFAIGNDVRICRVLPALDGMYSVLRGFKGHNYDSACSKLSRVIG